MQNKSALSYNPLNWAYNLQGFLLQPNKCEHDFRAFAKLAKLSNSYTIKMITAIANAKDRLDA